MPTTTVYNTGTVSVSNGATTVTGVATTWSTSGIQAGDLFRANGLTVRIAAVVSNTQLTLAYGWPGTALAGANYDIQFTPDATRVLATSRSLLDALSNGNISSLSGLATAADKLAYYTGAGTAALTAFTSFARSLLAGASAAAMRTTLGLGTMALESAANYVTATSAQTISGPKTFSAGVIVRAASGDSFISLGRVDGAANVNFIDFNTGATAIDYDSRIIATGGTGTVGAGTLNVAAGTFTWNGSAIIDAATAQTITGLKTLSRGAYATDTIYANFQPTDYGSIAPALRVKTSSAGRWEVYTWNGLTAYGTITFNSPNIDFVAGNLTWNGNQLLDIATTQTITGLKIVTIGNSTGGQDYARWRPNDYGTGKPQLGIAKALTADQWNIGLWDGANASGTIHFSSSGFSASGAYSQTTASAANLVVTATGLFQRSTSSIKYKTDVEPIDQDHLKLVLDFEPIFYRSLCAGDNPAWSWYGFSAEQVAAMDPRLVHWKTHEIITDIVEIEVTQETEVVNPETGEKSVVAEKMIEKQPRDRVVVLETPEPEGVAYERMVPHLIGIAKLQAAQIEALAARLEALEAA